MENVESESLRIREHTLQDLDRLHQIDALCFPPDIAFTRAELAHFLSCTGSICRVAAINDSTVGFVLGSIARDGTAHVQTLDVLPELRRRGIGTLLMLALHAEFLRSGAVRAYLEVSASDVGAQRFYRKLRYRYVETLAGYYNGHTDAHRMVRHFRGWDLPQG